MAIDDIGIEPLNVEEIGDSAREALRNSFEKFVHSAAYVHLVASLGFRRRRGS